MLGFCFAIDALPAAIGFVYLGASDKGVSVTQMACFASACGSGRDICVSVYILWGS